VDPVLYACALPVRAGRILLGFRAPHRRNYPSCWDTIGGHVEPGEAVERALVRELEEEIGIRVTAFRPLTIIHAIEADDRRSEWRLYLVTGWEGGEPILANDEHTRLGWFTPDELLDLAPLAWELYRPVFASLPAPLA
jgi:8-oxo-dGTP diphosphatase